MFYDSEGNFRFSFVKANYLGTKREFTEYKRYTYFVSPKQTNKTFIKQVGSCGFSSLDEIIEAFSVEPLNKQFYQEIAKAFYELIGGKYKQGTKTISADNPQLVLPSTPLKDNRKVYQEFAVRLIGRTIFCWFLKNKKSEAGIPLIPETWLSSNTVVDVNNQQHDYYHSVLEKLFFLVLNKRDEDRKDYTLPQDANIIPFLNGGLFEAHPDDFFPTDSQGIHQISFGLKIPNSWFLELFKVLEQYNFTIDENSIYDAEVSIDPEMLGTIFENLLAEIDPDTEKSARKATGSFYTPREIVDYMVEQSLVQYLKTKTAIDDEEALERLFKEGQETNQEDTFSTNKKNQILQALSDVKILDPACGSGAFPMGALHKIILALKKLDPGAKWWKQKQLEKVNNALIRSQLKEKLNAATSDYARKLGVIQHSIYGVDIQPIASEISKLRSFLSLVIDENIDDTAVNRGIEPLPNLEFKFVTANTLIGLPEEQGQQISMFDNYEELQLLEQLRADYLQSSGKKKEKIKERFLRVQKKAFKNEHNLFADTNSRSYKLISWNPFSNEASSWFDPQWMYGVDEFDIVIGNPPYVDSETMVSRNPLFREELKSAYNFAAGNWDLFVVFIERGINLLKDRGIFSYIIPNKLISAKYALTAREHINSLGIIEVRDYSRINVFVNADVYPITMTLINDTALLPSSKFTIMENLTTVKNCNIVNNDIIIDTLWDKYFYDSEIFKLLIKLSRFKKLIDISVDVTGAATVSEAYKIKEVVFDEEFHNNSFKLINTGTIDPYLSLWSIKNTQYIKDSYVYPRVKANDIKSININRFNQANASKIIIAGMSNMIEAFLDLKGDYLAGKSTSIILDDKDKLMYLTGLLNSKLVSFYINKAFHSLKMAGGYLNINNNIIGKIPVSNEFNKDIINQVDLIINEDGEFDEILKVIDILIFKDFNLTYQEVLLIDPAFSLTEEAYNNYKV
ncbi:MAG: hypothetical protein GY739_07085 [Mesoflavibacter sp.]|nr:hypothetical protein [Mesoflavibacter sp.]